MTARHNTLTIDQLPHEGVYVDAEGEVRPVDDDPELTWTWDETDETDVSDDVDLKSGSEIRLAIEHPLPQVDLGVRAIALARALDDIAHASMLQGLLDGGDSKKLAEQGGRKAVKESLLVAHQNARSALRTGSGVDSLIGTEFGLTKQDADDEMVFLMHGFKRRYTADAARALDGGEGAPTKRQAALDHAAAARSEFAESLRQQQELWPIPHNK